MEKVQHASCTRALGAPKGWDHAAAPCGALPVRDETYCGVQSVASFWRPTPAELAALAAGALVVLHVVGFGGTQPPVALTVEAP